MIAIAFVLRLFLFNFLRLFRFCNPPIANAKAQEKQSGNDRTKGHGNSRGKWDVVDS